MPDAITGLVLKRYSGFYYVQDADGEIVECKLRGKIKKQIVLAGDRVSLTPTNQAQGIIEEVLPRSVEMIRPAVANVQRVIVVMAFQQPEPSLRLLDKMLIMIRHQQLDAVLVLNKCDMGMNDTVSELLRVYPAAGYPVFVTSTETGEGIEDLAHAVSNSINVLAGPSGVGKSSLLNHLVPESNLLTGEVSAKIGRGKHTTRHVELIPLAAGGWIADTPGFSVIETPVIAKKDLTGYFEEFEAYTAECRFSDCMHAGETDCAVKDALEAGQVSASRYDSYLAVLNEIREREKVYR